MVIAQAFSGETVITEGAEAIWAEYLDALANPVLSLDQQKTKAKQLVLDRRHQIQDQSYPVIVSEGKTCLIQIDPDTLSNLTGKVVLILAGMDATTDNWKQADGVCIPLSNSEIMAAALGYSHRKQALFDREAALSDEIDAAVNPAAIDALLPKIESFWPIA